MKAAKQVDKAKAKAPKVDIGQLIVTDAWAKTFSSGKTGFFGRAVGANGDRYQIVGAVKIG